VLCEQLLLLLLLLLLSCRTSLQQGSWMPHCLLLHSWTASHAC
jgi:hypothetical protein